jgi:hypothetical protein
VNFGETLVVGSHVFICGDLEDETPLWDALKTYRPDLAYFSLPENNGTAQRYRDDGKPVDLIHLLGMALSPSVDLHLPSFIECLPYEAITDEIVRLGGVVTTWPASYLEDIPCVVVAADFRQPPVADYPDLSGLHVSAIPAVVFACYRPRLVLDVMAGEGSTASAATASINHDLNPRSLKRAIERVTP